MRAVNTLPPPGPKPIRKVLVANRGEIAVRVMRSCKELGIGTVAVFSDADRAAPHVRMADQAVRLGPPPARESYLDIGKVLAACKSTGADAVHPGYGFLSENEDFADACEAAGITFIGPSSDSMRAMGDKTSARKTVTAAGVPVVPGDNGPEGRGFPTTEAALAAARKIGFPVMLKASAGGGGKGMRLCESEAKFAAALEGARREALSAFGDDAVYLEKAIIRPRHVEIQVFADSYGNTVHMYERDCSIQRRHQKVIEESPSPAVTDDIRARMGKMAVDAAKACNYRGAGTIECLLDASGNFYFLEMNTRLQVEHPVTEMITGLDLVALQIRVAEGAKLPFTQAEIPRRGAALECRVYAEDPIRFLPSPGTITYLRTPAGPYVRDDSGVYSGSEISTFYDPMISKLCVWGDTREQAIARMRRAIGEYRVRGIKTNLPFHRRVLENAAFIAGDYDTSFIERHKADLQPTGLSADELDAGLGAAVAVRAAVALAPAAAPAQGGSADAPAGYSGWRRGRTGWRGGRG